MKILDWLTNYNFDHNLSYSCIVEDLKKKNTLVLIENFPLCDNDFQFFIDTIGVSIIENRNNNRQAVFDVKVARQNSFFESIANSNLAFPLHTDCVDFNSIPNCIAFLCVEPASLKEGTNSFMFLNNVIKQLSENTIQELLNKKWKFRNQSRSILTIEDEQYKICYDRITMESFSEISKIEIDKLNKLDELFESNSFNIKLKKGDLILFRNDLMLHGRNGININSNRLIKRIRFNIDLKT
ncbi:TfdA family taurine catabolism dioxygenase TauD [Flavobacterium sp. 270]|uniref:TauD/TfdA family dioxygenase n=1 Tax=Flavobacterium sp. 270 TaxID=2512114 RepID=UPI001064E977|nr:TauD/TfdA family dioxygenase [Flavobacterium sp. 270]TDW52198.1 TfdA family taurine catabolism dioxygenase TauD [Flavobacterium sp. 270]